METTFTAVGWLCTVSNETGTNGMGKRRTIIHGRARAQPPCLPLDSKKSDSTVDFGQLRLSKLKTQARIKLSLSCSATTQGAF